MTSQSREHAFTALRDVWADLSIVRRLVPKPGLYQGGLPKSLKETAILPIFASAAARIICPSLSVFVAFPMALSIKVTP